ncbi:L-aspartate oxidase [Pseudobacteriovorax antillogorgiicola]|uniref:L-aspartate oxidase n=1 Tax=Pseudobacteriovorax antillogorgiicola TaxID=1513793 RepID=A0A1Y6BUW9_9BACT|nr:L-aspartate oxidase [Pseudobacteriovorax antillogorgiicola]TCS53771.1 L-aspartate oxidase [Pseudobacteriovorax antillogorgiicola]SMF22451.1 L-aspartate oxidase [Pseudobacteriovorax antillogorgiicola]
MESVIATDHLIIGSGISGLMLAHKLAAKDKVTVIAKGSLFDNNTRYAQGGIASVLSPKDSFEKHIEDTEVAGAGLCHPEIVSVVVRGGPKAIRELIDLGVDFTKRAGAETESVPYHLTKEGGHSKRRVIHSDDLTGKEVLRALVEAVKANPNVTIYENAFAVDLITTDRYAPSFSENICLGAYVLRRETDDVICFQSRRTYLCAGGHGKAYLYTSNPDGATGDGLAMGWRAGCKVANLEFMQFHPTCLFHPDAKNFLISEAVRGEGAVLKDASRQPFMKRYHHLGSLAPRDIVARAIDLELKKSGSSHLYLDATEIGAEKVKEHFPNIYNTCLKYGIDITKDMIPVVPAAHYSCGGLVVDEHGRTNVHGLFALGEVACTGLHGANRLASNSLLEALVFADRVAAWALDHVPDGISDVNIPKWNSGDTIVPDELVVLTHTWDEIRRLMWNYVGIVRSEKRLQRAFDRIISIRKELDTYYWHYQISDVFLEVRNLADVAYLTIKCARKRKESRGIHYNIDYPVPADDSPAKDTVIW